MKDLTWKEKRRRAEEVLARNSALGDTLNRVGFVRVPIPVDLPAVPGDTDGPPVYAPVPIATFTLEYTVLGRRVMVEIDGRKEFCG